MLIEYNFYKIKIINKRFLKLYKQKFISIPEYPDIDLMKNIA